MYSIPFQIKDRKLVYNELSFGRFAGENEGKRGNIVITEPVRSLSQLRMYRAWLTNTSEHTGNDTEELHEYLIEKCAPKKVVSIHGKKGIHETTKSKRTSQGHSLSMNKLEMGEFMDKCVALTGYPLPTKAELEAMGYIIEWQD